MSPTPTAPTLRGNRGPGGLWSLHAPEDSLDQPMVANGRIHLLIGGRATALDAADGSTVWQSRIDLSEPEREWSRPVHLAAGRLLVPSAAAHLISDQDPDLVGFSAFEARHGEWLWTREPAVLNNWRLAGDVLLLWTASPGEHRLTAVDTAGGSTLWHRDFTRIDDFALLGGRVVLGASPDGGPGAEVIGLDARTGQPLWRADWLSTHQDDVFFFAPPAGTDPARRTAVYLWSDRESTLRTLAVADGRELAAFTAAVGKEPGFDEAAVLTGEDTALWFRRRAGRHLFRADLRTGATTHRFSRFLGAVSDRDHLLAVLPDRQLYVASESLGDLLWAELEPVSGSARGSAGGPALRKQRLKDVPWPSGIPELSRVIDLLHGFVPGPRHLFVHTVPVLNTLPARLLAVRDGRVQWHRTTSGLHHAVPCGDRHLLVIDAAEDGDVLHLSDADTGATAD